MKTKQPRNILISLALSAFMLTSAQAANFTDLPANHQNYDAVMFLTDRGVIEGYPDGTFKPEQVVNRVEAIKMIFAALPVQDPEVLIYGDFPDIDQSAWYSDSFRKAFSLGIVEGYEDGYFRPAQTVNLVENLKILFESAETKLPENITENPYNDAQAGQWYTPYVQLAKDLNLIDADNQNNIYPAQAMSRGALAETIYRYVMVIENNLETFDPEQPKPEQQPKNITLTVRIEDLSFIKEELTVPQGATVKWINNDSVDHTVTADNGSFDSGTIAPGETFTRSFDELGEYTYTCATHPAMTGKLIVKPANQVPTI